jgi:hypothetical protein
MNTRNTVYIYTYIHIYTRISLNIYTTDEMFITYIIAFNC